MARPSPADVPVTRALIDASLSGRRKGLELHPCSVLDAAIARFGELHVADARGKIRLHRRAGHEMAQEVLPADAIRVLEWPRLVDLLPVGAVVDVEVGGDGEM